MKTLCLFAGYDKDGIIDNYVLYSIKQFSKICDVYYLSDCKMNNNSKSELAPFVKGMWTYRHKKYDFGSWSELIKNIGWDTICKYDNLILINDSVYGPFYDIKKVIDNFYKSNADFYGFTPNPKRHSYHIQSYFIMMKHNVFVNKKVQRFFDDIKELSNKGDIIKLYEKGFSNLLYSLGFKSDTFIKNYDCYFPNQILNQDGFLLKVSIFTQYMSKEDITNLFPKLKKKYPQYDFNLIFNHLKRKNVNLDKVIRKSILKSSNYKTMAGIDFILPSYLRVLKYPLYIILNLYTCVYNVLLRRLFVKPYRSIKKHVFHNL